MLKKAIKTLKKSLPVEHIPIINKIKETAKELGIKAYITGGYVRDLVLGKPSADIDIMCEKGAEKLVKRLVEKYSLSTPVVYGRSQAIAVVIDGHPIDFIDAEKVVYPFGGTLEGKEEFGISLDDIYRRDLTINTLVYDLSDDTIKDLTGKAFDDLKNGIVRTVIDPNIKYRIHPADILRAIRFAAAYNFKIAESVFNAMKKYKEGLLPRDKGGDISNRRIRRELRKMSADDETWNRGLEIMKTVGLISVIGSDIQDVIDDREAWYRKKKPVTAAAQEMSKEEIIEAARKGNVIPIINFGVKSPEFKEVILELITRLEELPEPTRNWTVSMLNRSWQETSSLLCQLARQGNEVAIVRLNPAQPEEKQLIEELAKEGNLYAKKIQEDGKVGKHTLEEIMEGTPTMTRDEWINKQIELGKILKGSPDEIMDKYAIRKLKEDWFKDSKKVIQEEAESLFTDLPSSISEEDRFQTMKNKIVKWHELMNKPLPIGFENKTPEQIQGMYYGMKERYEKKATDITRMIYAQPGICEECKEQAPMLFEHRINPGMYGGAYVPGNTKMLCHKCHTIANNPEYSFGGIWHHTRLKNELGPEGYIEYQRNLAKKQQEELKKKLGDEYGSNMSLLALRRWWPEKTIEELKRIQQIKRDNPNIARHEIVIILESPSTIATRVEKLVKIASNIRKSAGALNKLAQFEGKGVSTTSASIGNIKIDTTLNAQKIKDALKLLYEKDSSLFAKARDFDYIISDVTAKRLNINVPSSAVAWFNTAYSETCFIKKDYVDKSSLEDIASTIAHESIHERNPQFSGESMAERYEHEFAKKF